MVARAAYNLVFSRGPGGEHYLAIGGRAGDDITRQDVVELGREQGIAKDLRDFTGLRDRSASVPRRSAKFVLPATQS
jgi:hypothetical protein